MPWLLKYSSSKNLLTRNCGYTKTIPNYTTLVSLRYYITHNRLMEHISVCDQGQAQLGVLAVHV